jgi:hypothetical protein
MSHDFKSLNQTVLKGNKKNTYGVKNITRTKDQRLEIDQDSEF